MNLDIFRNPDPSGKLYKESFLYRNFPEEYNFIVSYCDINKIVDISFKEKVYLVLNELKSIPACKNPNCNNRVKFKNSTIGYLKYCSKKSQHHKSLHRFHLL